MAKVDDETELPTQFYKSVIDDFAQEEGFKKISTLVKLGSSKGENYLGNIYRIKITGERNGIKDTELSVIMKIPLQYENMREKFPIGLIFTREAYVYNTVIPKLKKIQEMFEIPKEEKIHFVNCYKASPEIYKEFLILEDLREVGYEMAQRRSPLQYSSLKLVTQTLARYHALSFVLKRVEPELYNEFSDNLTKSQDFGPEMIDFMKLAADRSINVLEDENIKEKVKAFCTNLGEKFEEYLNPLNVGIYAVLCHGDCWNNNVLFKYKNGDPVDLRLIDWQVVKNASPVTDIAYLISTSTDEELRNNRFTEVMDIYYDTLGQSLKYMGYDVETCYPKKIFDEHLRKFMPYGFLMSFMLLPAVLGEAEDVPDMDALLKKDKADSNDFKFENKESSLRFETRMRGLAKFYIEQNFI